MHNTLHTTFQYNPRIHYSNTLISNIPIIVQNQVNVEIVLHNLELLGVDPDQSWVVDAENTGRVASIFFSVDLKHTIGMGDSADGEAVDT